MPDGREIGAPTMAVPVPYTAYLGSKVLLGERDVNDSLSIEFAVGVDHQIIRLDLGDPERCIEIGIVA